MNTYPKKTSVPSTENLTVLPSSKIKSAFFNKLIFNLPGDPVLFVVYSIFSETAEMSNI
jgi:hypothetical protein